MVAHGVNHSCVDTEGAGRPHLRCWRGGVVVVAGRGTRCGRVLVSQVVRERWAPRFRWRTLGVLMVLVACHSQGASGRVSRPAEVTIVMTDAVIRTPSRIASGRVVFRVTNRGQHPHQLSLFVMSPDTPPIGIQLRGSSRRAVDPVAGLADVRPSASRLFATDLIAGERYGLVSFGTAPDGKPYALHGMASEFRTGAVTTGRKG